MAWSIESEKFTHDEFCEMNSNHVNACKNQGYVTIAYGARKFFEMAVNLALSVKLNDPGRPICLMHKGAETVPGGVSDIFDDVVAFPANDHYVGTAIKLTIDRIAPYDEVFYVDSDCIILKKDMDRHWRKHAEDDFMMAGEMRTDGFISSLDVKRMMEAAGVGYVVDMNSGAFFFRRSKKSKRVFETARHLYHDKQGEFTEIRARRADGIGDQAFFGAAMAVCDIRPLAYDPCEGTIMATTYRARNIDFDLDQPCSSLEKATGFRILGRFWAKGWVKHDTTIGHFVDGMPKKVYQRVSDQLRAKFDWPSYDFCSN